LDVINDIEGKVYHKTINSGELNFYKEEYNVISDKLFQGKPIINILSENDPGNGFTSIPSSLEDVYFSQIFGDNRQIKN